MKELMNRMQEIIAAREKAALCMVVQTKGSTPLKTGAKMLVRSDGSTYGTIGGGNLELSVTGEALEVISKGKAGLFEHHLVRDHAMCCGGTVQVYIEPIPVASRLYIFGAGHVGKALAMHASMLDFEVTVIDNRPRIFNGWKPGNITCINGNFTGSLQGLGWDESTYAVIATYTHKTDREILAHCLRQPSAYVGMIGSKRKVLVTKRLFIESGIATGEELDRADMPIGMDIKAHTPHEIAVSILAGMIERRNAGRPSVTRATAPGEWETAGAECLAGLKPL